MKLSIIIPYYNADEFIGRCFDSLLHQDLRQDEYEIIVIDDGSQDDTSTLKEYVRKYNQIRCVRQNNTGPGAARNKGLELAHGDYVFFCDSDDFVAENVLGSLCDMASQKNLDMLFHNRIDITNLNNIRNSHRNFDQFEIFPTGKHYLATLEGAIKSGPTLYIINRKFVEKNNLRFPNGIMTEDSTFFIDALMNAGNVAKVDVDVYYYIMNPQSLYHFSGKKLQAKRYTDNIYNFVQKLSFIINSTTSGEMPPKCLANLKALRNEKVYLMLLNSCKYLPLSKTWHYTSELKKLGAYPIQVYGNIAIRQKKVMSIPWLWYTSFITLGLIPSNLRKRFL